MGAAMDKLNLKNILTAVRDIIKRNRVAYKDYLGEETITETKTLVTASLVAGDKATVTADPSFTGFVEGETYDVTLNGETTPMVAKDISWLIKIIGGS